MLNILLLLYSIWIFLLRFQSKLFMSPVNAKKRSNYHIKHIQADIMECVIDFAYTFNCDINVANLCELLATAEYFCYSMLVDRCVDFIKNTLNLDNCISFMQMTRFLLNINVFTWTNLKISIESSSFVRFFSFSPSFIFRKYLYKHEIQRTIRGYILCNFIEISKHNDKLLTLSIEELVDLINDDALNAKNEEPIWEFCLRWIEFDEKNRPASVPKLLESIRLGLMNKNVRHTSSL